MSRPPWWPSAAGAAARGLMTAWHSGDVVAVGSARLPGRRRVAFDQTLSTPDIYTAARFAPCHKTSAPPPPPPHLAHRGRGDV